MKKTVLIEESEARKIYLTAASPEFKQMLETSFGKAFFSMKVTDRIKTYEDACSELGEQPIDEKKLKEFGFTNDEITYLKLKTITKALNEGWKCDWNDSNQSKYYPWFHLFSGGFVFYAAVCVDSGAFAGCASRLCFPTKEMAEYAGKQFLPLYSDFIK